MIPNERPTPLTDESEQRMDDIPIKKALSYFVPADFARTLERSLAERTKERDKAQQDCASYCCTIDMLTDERDALLIRVSTVETANADLVANVDGLRAALMKINQISNTSDGGRWDEIEKARDVAVAALYPKAHRTKREHQ